MVVRVIMSNLLTGVATQAGLTAQSSGQTASQAARNAEGNTAQAQIVQNAIASGAASNPAVVVSLSKQGKRAASYGEGRSVDQTFEKKEEKAAGGKDEEDVDGKKKSAVNVTA